MQLVIINQPYSISLFGNSKQRLWKKELKHSKYKDEK